VGTPAGRSLIFRGVRALIGAQLLKRLLDG
jgi:hypothetical protein